MNTTRVYAEIAVGICPVLGIKTNVVKYPQEVVYFNHSCK